MGRIILFNMMSLDGFFEGKNNELDWHNVDAEFNDFAIEQLNNASALIFGRVTYDLMSSYWATSLALSDDPIVAKKMNTIQKIVFSKTMEKAEWVNTILIKGDIEAEIKKLKDLEKDILVLGSANLSSTLIKLDLVDEFRIMVNPVILGEGNPLFKEDRHRKKLKFLRSKTFNSGNVLLCYAPKR